MEGGWRGNLKEMENGCRKVVQPERPFSRLRPFLLYFLWHLLFFQQHFLKVLFLYSLLLKCISVFCISSLALPQRTVLAARPCLSQDFAEPCFLLVELHNFTAPLLQLILWWIPEPFLLPAV